MPTETSSKCKVSFACEKGPFGSRDILCHELSCLNCVSPCAGVCMCTLYSRTSTEFGGWLTVNVK